MAMSVSGSEDAGLLGGRESWRVIEFVVVCLLRTGEWVEGIEVGEEPMDVTFVSGAGLGFETEVLREGVEDMQEAYVAEVIGGVGSGESFWQ